MADPSADELRAIAKYLRGGNERVRAAMRPVLQASAERVKSSARKAARHPSAPKLSRAITYETIVTNSSIRAEIGPDQAISGLGLGFEFGSSHTPPHPFMFPAADVEEPKFQAAIDKALGDAWENLP